MRKSPTPPYRPGGEVAPGGTTGLPRNGSQFASGLFIAGSEILLPVPDPRVVGDTVFAGALTPSERGRTADRASSGFGSPRPYLVFGLQ